MEVGSGVNTSRLRVGLNVVVYVRLRNHLLSKRADDILQRAPSVVQEVVLPVLSGRLSERVPSHHICRELL